MKVTVFGSTGKTGQRVVHLSLERGHEVTAFGRSVERIESAPGLSLRKGDVFDVTAVSEAIAAQDAVIVCLGSANLKDATTLTRGTANIVEAMAAHEVDRLVVLSAAGAGDSWGHIPLSSKVLFWTMLKNVMADHNAQEAVVRASVATWTIARAAVLSEKPGTGAVRHGLDIKAKKITRADVALFLVDQLSSTEYHRQAPSISN